MWSTAQGPVSRTRHEVSVSDVRDRLERLRDEIVAEGDAIYAGWQPSIARPSFALSARNLAYYLALRRRDLRELQLELTSLGLSSLGRCESRVLENLDAVLWALERVDGIDPPRHRAPAYRAFFAGQVKLRRHSTEALGSAPARRAVRIMVTLPSRAAEDPGLVADLVARGMDLARINCAHDDPAAWRAMAANVRRAAADLGRHCRVCADICGPRARTASVREGDGKLHAGAMVVMRTAAQDGDAGLPGFVCSLPEVVGQLVVGDAVWIDGGRLQTVLRARDARGTLLEVTRAPPKGGRLRNDKGLNFPGTALALDALTAKDLGDLDAVVQFADLVGYSFVQRPEDVHRLQAELARRGAGGLPVALKIETQLAVANLPQLIVAAAGRQPLAVMLARGDLAVELGYRRLAEMQEELLWLCEAAHVPVIWATEVLDTYVHSGLGARAEMTDAAMAGRAECVMLNKGPFLPEGISLLADVLGRMEAHQYKKTSRMRALRAW